MTVKGIIIECYYVDLFHTRTNKLRSNAEPEEIASYIEDVTVIAKKEGYGAVVSAIIQ